MFNFFKNKSEENEVLASITYLIKKDKNNVLIDVRLDDLENESIEGLSSILEVLCNNSFYTDTINIIRDSLIKEGRYDILGNVLSKTESKIREKIIDSAKDRLKNEPYIKPSEMFK